MGFEDVRFVGPVEDNYRCLLCRGVLDNPVYTPCRRLFCAGCALPAVLQKAVCPAPGCTETVHAADLQNALELRRTILGKDVRCDYASRGCHGNITLADLPNHVQVCRFRPSTCDNKGCTKVMNQKDLNVHEREDCEFRPVGICQKGCKLVILYKDRNLHTCIEALRAHITSQEMRMSAMESDFQKACQHHDGREKTLLAKLSNLHNEIQQQAAGFQKKLKDYSNRIAYLNRMINTEDKGFEESKLMIKLERQDGCLGFNIMGGYTKDSSPTSEGIVVSRVTEDSPAGQHGMCVHDTILKVSSLSAKFYKPENMKIHPVINGQDLSGSSHEEAVQAFQSASEPIVVEVLRRVAKGNQPASCSHSNKMKTRSPPAMVSTATQTEEVIEEAYLNMFRPATPPFTMCGFDNLALVPPTSRHAVAFSPGADLGLSDLDMGPGLELDEEYDRAYDMEYEEVTLHRRSSKEKIGLTLCYGNTEDDITDIFISEVEPYSIAAQDGRIREGDQILQINATDVHSREQAIQLFSDNRADISLLLARPQIVPMDDGFMDERTALDALQSQVLDQTRRRDLDFTAAVFAHGAEEEGATTDTATTENSAKHDKDSGVGRTDDSTKNDESSEQEMLDVDPSPASKYHHHHHHHTSGGDSSELHHSNDSFTSTDPDAALADELGDKFRRVLETRCQAKALGRKDSQSSIEREIAALNQEMEQIQMECQNIVEAHSRDSTRRGGQAESSPGGSSPSASANKECFRSPRQVPRMGTRLDHLKQLHAGAAATPDLPDPASWTRHLEAAGTDQPSSSGVSTMDSHNARGRSTPLTLELAEGADSGRAGSMLCLAAPTKAPEPSETPPPPPARGLSSSRSHSNSSVSRMSQTADQESLQELYTQYADVMYTNQANLQHTIMVQQKLFQQQLMQRAAAATKLNNNDASVDGEGKAVGAHQTVLSPHNHIYETIRSPPPAVPATPPPKDNGNQSSCNASSGGGLMEWVVKRRADGSRYITRRPVRSKLLKERGKKITEERCGMTTDDDAMSEMKVGRYWSKEERKRHLEKARDHRRKKEILKTKMETVKETVEENPTSQTSSPKKEPNIVELSHRKMMKHKGKKVFDDFTTLQEMLAHGSRETQGKNYNPLLSVTTV